MFTMTNEKSHGDVRTHVTTETQKAHRVLELDALFKFKELHFAGLAFHTFDFVLQRQHLFF